MAFRGRWQVWLFAAAAFGGPVPAAALGPAPPRGPAPAAASTPASPHGTVPAAASTPASPRGAAAPASTPASAAGATSAAEAYDEGVERYRQRRFGEAARAFARADELSPHPIALRQALEAAALADDPALAMALAERVEAREGATGEASALVARARARYGDKAGKFVLRCPPRAADCGALVDGDAAALGPPLGGWALAGVHTVHLKAAGRLEPRTVFLGGGQTLELSPVLAGPASERAAPAPGGGAGLRPGWFWGGLALTGALGVASAWSALDTASRHDDFRRDREAGAAGPGQADEGRAAQARTNALGAATIAVGLATAALGLFAVRWRPRAPAPDASAGARPAGVAFCF